MRARDGWWRAAGLGRETGGRLWTFEVDRTATPAAVAWRWARHDDGTLAARSHTSFPSFLECARDAGAHGFTPRDRYRLRESGRTVRSPWARPAGPDAERRTPSV